VTTTGHADTDVDLGEGVLAAGGVGESLLEEEDGLVDLVAEDLGFDKVDGGTVDTDETLALLNTRLFVGYLSRGVVVSRAYLGQCDGRGSLLLAKGLDALLSRRHYGSWKRDEQLSN
jgi:hypothetical protein